MDKNQTMNHHCLPLKILVACSMIPLMLHILGIYCLWKQKSRKDTQKYLLLHLSIVDIIMITMQVGSAIVSILNWNLSSLKESVIFAFNVVTVLLYYMTMYVITFDRLLCVVLNIKYNYYVTPGVIKRVIIVVWLISLILFILLCVIDVNSYASFVGIVLLILIIVLLFITTVTYIAIIISVKKTK